MLPPSVDDWLTQYRLARFVVEVIDGLDLSRRTRQYAGRGSKAHHPATLLAILVYGYSTRVFSSRKLEMALAEQADTANIPDGMSLPRELKLRQDRLAAKARIAARAAERYAREKAEFDEKMSKRLHWSERLLSRQR